MTKVGIEAINAYCGLAYIDAVDLMEARGLDARRAGNLMMRSRSVALPCEDTVSMAVNAALPIVSSLTPEERKSIELVVTATESGVDSAKSLSTWVHHLLDLPRSCRMYEVKQACYGGTAALQAAAASIAHSRRAGAKALVIASDVPVSSVGTYHEPSQGCGAVAALVSDTPDVAVVDLGASGYHGFHVMDAYRPRVDLEFVNSDLSLMSYLDCLHEAFLDYTEKVVGAHFVDSFDQIVMHTPFPGMVKGAHRMLLRRLGYSGDLDVAADFDARAEPSTRYARKVGNPYSASVLLALASTIVHGNVSGGSSIGVFSYGSGCSSEFYRCFAGEDAERLVAAAAIDDMLERRVNLDIPTYDRLCVAQSATAARDHTVDFESLKGVLPTSGDPVLLLSGIADYQRSYRMWDGSV